MPEENKHIAYSATDIEKYHQGLLSAADMHAMERAALEDSFLADAMEGYEAHTTPAATDAPTAPLLQDIEDLNNRLAARIATKKTVPVIRFYWWRIAAIVLLLAGAGLLYIGNKSTGDLAIKNHTTVQDRSNNKNEAAALTGDSASEALTDSTGNIATTKSYTPALAKRSPAHRSKAGEPLIPVSVNHAAKSLPSRKDTTGYGFREDNKEDLASVGDKKAGTPMPAATMRNKVPGLITRENTADQASPASGKLNMFGKFSGRVVDQQDRPLVNAVIQVPHQAAPAVTDKNGYFFFQATDTAVNVSVASVGFETQQLRLHNDIADNQVTLKPSVTTLNEVVITGYGTYKKQNVQASVTKDMSIKVLGAVPVIEWNAYKQYLIDNKRIAAETKDIHGPVVVSFMVDKKGRLKNFNIEQSLQEQLDKEAIRLIKEGPGWKLLKGKKAKASVVVQF